MTPEAEYAVESVAQMARLLHLSDEGVRFLASVLWSHGDESGTGEDSPVFAFAGFVAPAESWGPFSERWVEALRLRGLNRFHATDCFAGYQDFKGWSKEECQALVAELIEIIVATTNVRGYCSIIKRGTAESRGEIFGLAANEPFVSGFGSLVHGICRRAAEINGRERIAFIFDQQREWKERALAKYVKMKDAPDLDHSNRLGTAAFESSNQYVPLQAADLLSHQLRRLFFTHGREAATAKNVERLCKGRLVLVDILDRQLMEDVYWPLGLAAFLREA